MSWCKATLLLVACAASIGCGAAADTPPPAETAAETTAPSMPLQGVAPLPEWGDGSWRIVRAVVAPWATKDTADAPNTRRLIGASVRFYDGTVGGPPAMACDGAQHTLIDVPADQLFEGALRDSAMAVALGVGAFPVATVRVTCNNGVHDYHRVDSASMLVAVDSVIYTLVQSEISSLPGTHPAGVVQALLEAHFADDMSFDRVRTGRKQQWLSPTLWLDMQDYFVRPVSADEPPVINGDPFTNTQEYPARFVLTNLEEGPIESRVQVVFRDAYRTTRSTFVLQRTQDEWRVHDIVYEDGSTLRTMLQPA